jgi:hypothetical protein
MMALDPQQSSTNRCSAGFIWSLVSAIAAITAGVVLLLAMAVQGQGSAARATT